MRDIVRAFTITIQLSSPTIAMATFLKLLRLSFIQLPRLLCFTIVTVILSMVGTVIMSTVGTLKSFLQLQWK